VVFGFRRGLSYRARLPLMTEQERQKRNLDVVRHIVHDWANLVAAGKMTAVQHSFPLNHFIQHAFLVECRKFAAFFKNNRGPLGQDIIAKDFVCKRFKPHLPIWKKWHDHMNRHLMHLSYERLTTPTLWTGWPNQPLLAEFVKSWDDFLTCVDAAYAPQFRNELNRRG
jgi:hypothetical protein